MIEIDARGLECPIPTRRAVEAMKRACERGDDDALVVQTDDAICAADIPYHARVLGYDARSERSGGEAWTITLRRAIPKAAGLRRL